MMTSAPAFDFATVPQVPELPDTPAFIEAMNENLVSMLDTPTWPKSATPFLAKFAWGATTPAAVVASEHIPDNSANNNNNEHVVEDDNQEDDDDDDDDDDVASSFVSDDDYPPPAPLPLAPEPAAAPAPAMPLAAPRTRASARRATAPSFAPPSTAAAAAAFEPLVEAPPLGRKGAPRGPRKRVNPDSVSEDDRRREFDARLEKNRISARECRLRKKAKIQGFMQRIAMLEAENAALRSKLAALSS